MHRKGRWFHESTTTAIAWLHLHLGASRNCAAIVDAEIIALTVELNALQHLSLTNWDGLAMVFLPWAKWLLVWFLKGQQSTVVNPSASMKKHAMSSPNNLQKSLLKMGWIYIYIYTHVLSLYISTYTYIYIYMYVYIYIWNEHIILFNSHRIPTHIYIYTYTIYIPHPHRFKKQYIYIYTYTSHLYPIYIPSISLSNCWLTYLPEKWWSSSDWIIIQFLFQPAPGSGTTSENPESGGIDVFFLNDLTVMSWGNHANIMGFYLVL